MENVFETVEIANTKLEVKSPIINQIYIAAQARNNCRRVRDGRFFFFLISATAKMEMKMEECEVIDLYELHYSDLSSSSSSSTKVDSIMEALGANGPGLLAVTGIPNASNFRSYLLPLARNLSLLDRLTRNRILKVINYSILISIYAINMKLGFIIFRVLL